MRLILFGLILILIYQLYVTTYGREGFKVVPMPATLEELKKLVAQRKDVDVSKLDQILQLDPENYEVTVQTGCTIKQLCEYLEQYGLALACVPEDLSLQIGKACSFAAHGSNLDTGTMAEQIVRLDTIAENGNVMRVEASDPEFPAFAVSLDKLGLLYSITLKCVSLYDVVVDQQVGDWNNLREQLLDIVAAAPLSKIYIQPVTLQTTAMIRSPIPQPASNGISYYKVLSKPTSRSAVSCSVAVPIEHTVEAIEAILEQCAENCSLSISFTGPDHNKWYSPTADRTSAWITVSFSLPLIANVDDFMQQFQNLLIEQYSGRPDWTGKVFMDDSLTRMVYGPVVDSVNKLRDHLSKSTFII